MTDDMDILQRWAAMKLGSSDADVLIGMVAEMTAAARSAALEEAAKVAAEFGSLPHGALPVEPFECAQHASESIAAAIRKLKT